MSPYARASLPKIAIFSLFIGILSAFAIASPASAAPAASRVSPADSAAVSPAGSPVTSPAAGSAAVTPAGSPVTSPAAGSAAVTPAGSPVTSPAGSRVVSPLAARRAARLGPGEIARLRGLRIVAAAAAQRGKPYRRGAQGPRAFDCSGLSGYAYRAAHLRLPRTADQQYRAVVRISRANARPGDLVFWVHGSHAYHVAVYAGTGKVWHAPKPGDRVRLARIWGSREVRFGRVGPAFPK